MRDRLAGRALPPLARRKRSSICFWLGALVTGLLGIAPAQTNFITITTNGPATNRLNILILAEGYRANQFAQFQTDATNLANLLLTNQPYAEYRSYCNVAALAVPSVEAGSDHPNASLSVNTYFNSSYGVSDYYLSIPENATGQGKVDALIATYLPQTDLAILLVNDSTPGGSDGGGRTAVMARGAVFGNSYAILAHETGHVLANLGDEYDDAFPGYPDTEEPNTTRTTNRIAIKWNAWIATNTPVPTPPTSQYQNAIGLFEGAHYHPTGWYRPKLNCMMKSFGVGFCEVCTEALVLAFYRQVRPVESFMPAATNQTLTSPATVNFSLNTVQPVGHALAFEWRTNGVTVTGATNASFSLSPGPIGNGLLTLVGRAFDPTPWVRTDPTNLLSQSVTWNVTISVPQLQLWSPRRVGGKLAFEVTGFAPQGVVIQASSNLVTWSPVATNSLTTGQFSYTNHNQTNLPTRFFRAVTPP